MKNLPDDELFNSLENRLRNYSEYPDDEVWSRISGSIPSIEPEWVLWTNRSAATLSVILLCLLFYREMISTNIWVPMSMNVVEGEKRSEPRESSTNSNRRLPSPAIRSERSQAIKGGSVQSAGDVATDSGILVAREFKQKIAGIGIDNPEDQVKKSDNEMFTENRGLIAEEKLRSDSVLTYLREVEGDSAETINHIIPPHAKKKKSRLTFYSMVSPSLSFHHVTPDSKDGVVVEKVSSPGVISSERFGYSIETGIQGQFAERFQYIAGLSYYHQSQRLEYQQNTDGVMVESGEDMNFVIKPETTLSSFEYSMRNIGVQAGILYILKPRGLMHKAGVVLQYQRGLMQASDDGVYDNSSSNYVNYQVLYRMEYEFRSGIGLFVQPSYTHSIVSNEHLNAPFKLKQSRASLGIGIVYRF